MYLLSCFIIRGMRVSGQIIGLNPSAKHAASCHDLPEDPSSPPTVTPEHTMAQNIILISGTTRGVGKGLLKIYLSRPNYTVIAANRDPQHPLSKALYDLPKGPGSNLVIVKVDATVETDALEAIRGLKDIDHLDLVIANAGIAKKYPKVADLKAADLLEHMTTNVLGAVWLFQATLPLLMKAENPSWVTVGSDAGCIQVR